MSFQMSLLPFNAVYLYVLCLQVYTLLQKTLAGVCIWLPWSLGARMGLQIREIYQNKYLWLPADRWPLWSLMSHHVVMIEDMGGKQLTKKAEKTLAGWISVLFFKSVALGKVLLSLLALFQYCSASYSCTCTSSFIWQTPSAAQVSAILYITGQLHWSQQRDCCAQGHHASMRWVKKSSHIHFTCPEMSSWSENLKFAISWSQAISLILRWAAPMEVSETNVFEYKLGKFWVWGHFQYVYFYNCIPM